MLILFLADVSKNFILNFYANAFPYYVFTFLYYERSILFPSKYLITLECACSEILDTQVCKL